MVAEGGEFFVTRPEEGDDGGGEAFGVVLVGLCVWVGKEVFVGEGGIDVADDEVGF